VIDRITRFGARFKRQHGTRLAFASDEFYIKAGALVPPVSFYEDLPQIENGVGMVADFLRDAGRMRPTAGIEPVTATVVTGASFSPVLKDALGRLKRVTGLTLRLVTVRNGFFGPSVTVAGLLTGSDIAAALAGKRLGDMVFIPEDALKEDDNIFLDGMSLDRLGNLLGVRIYPVRRLRDMLALLRRKGRQTV
jgi:NifB/MoaA-like Fe-S oxidoreductase